MRGWFVILICFTVVALGRENPGRRRYLVKDLKGHVLAWPPWAASWRPLKKDDPIWEDTLIQVGDKSSITFELSANEGFTGLKADSMVITLNTPILMRLRENIPRRVTLNDYFIPKIPEAKPEKGLADLTYQDLREAWERFAANILPDAAKGLKPPTLDGENPATSSVSMRAKKIRIYSPSQGSLSITQSLPEEVRISWKAVPEPNIKYGIRLWTVDKARPEPMDFTTQDFYTVNIAKEGNYLVQISSEDNRWQSEVRQFSVVLPMANRGEPPSLTHVNLPLPLSLPPKNFVFFPKKLPTSVVFEWDRPNAAKGKQTYTFVLSDLQGKELLKRDLSDTLFSLKFTNPGTYRWFVVSRPSTADADSTAGRIFSEVRTLSLLNPPRQVAGKPDPLESLMAVQSSRIFYLEDGF